MKTLRRIVIGLVALLGLFLAASVTLVLWLRAPVPEGGVSGAPADALARSIEQAANTQAWDRVGAIQWSQGGRREHLWDRRRNLDRLRVRDLEVLIDLGTKRGVATEAGKPLGGEALENALNTAYAAWINDSFWLNPLVKLFDPGVKREKVTVDGETGLLITYQSGGLTPGDQYLWLLGDGGLPRAWRMWTSIFPIQGIEVTWESWQTLPGGTKISTVHRMPAITIDMAPVKAAATLEELTGGEDPFSALFE